MSDEREWPILTGMRWGVYPPDRKGLEAWMPDAEEVMDTITDAKPIQSTDGPPHVKLHATDSGVDKEVISVLEEMLERAKTGEIRAVALVFDARTCSGNRWAGLWDRPQLLYSFERWKNAWLNAH